MTRRKRKTKARDLQPYAGRIITTLQGIEPGDKEPDIIRKVANSKPEYTKSEIEAALIQVIREENPEDECLSTGIVVDELAVQLINALVKWSREDVLKMHAGDRDK